MLKILKMAMDGLKMDFKERLAKYYGFFKFIN